MNIDTTGWGEFWLTEVFDMKNTKSITAANLIPNSGATPYVTSQAGNNGVQMLVSCPDEWLDRGPCIMIGGKTLVITYQSADFCSNDSHNIALYTRSDDPASRSVNTQLFLVTALRASLSSKYSWGDSISMKTIRDDVFKLPVDVDGAPAWRYMGRMMRDVVTERGRALAALLSIEV